MAIGTPTSIGSVDPGAVAHTTIVLTTTAVAEVRTRIIVGIAEKFTSRVLSSVTESAGNAYAIDKVASGSANSSAFVASADLTTELPSGGMITATFDSQQMGAATLVSRELTEAERAVDFRPHALRLVRQHFVKELG